ncbi:polysaccharide biosynthesis protein [Desulfosarcina ovata]|uniref:polysaccharide biosynthesis protein n=1 Tax=Desulfosarcina ovata TaxID=83564 RepID=UPI001E4AD427|nr:polysaccharide biosynthesis protein [Desulfosarcina ovata]
MPNNLNGKRVFVTGACGTIGSELVRQLLKHYEIAELTGIDNNESELFFLEQRFLKHNNAAFYLSDIRDVNKLTRVMRGADVVFHTAALKHVILCERSPFEAVQTNINGVKNLIDAAIANNVERFIFTSSDKAVNPTNVMGTSKLMGERIITAANSNNKGRTSLFASTRFGNVLGSRGSVIPIFKKQIQNGGPVTLTDNDMTRFIMSIKEAVQLVIDSARHIKGGEVFITKMPVIRIRDLAEVMIEQFAPRYGYRPEEINITIIGTKPGEKMYEELMNHEETRRSVELEKYFAVVPAFKGIYQDIDYTYPNIVSTSLTNPYHSGNETPLTKKELKTFLDKNGLLVDDDEYKKDPAERYWP